MKENPNDGLILIDKSEGETSFNVVKKVRRITGIKKVGHAGTLDPFATGLLVILLGRGTKLSNYLMEGKKSYRAIMRLGIETDTQDLTGRVTGVKRVPELEPECIREKALEFVGEIEQIPPLFSAVRHKGRRAYALARQGVKVDLKKRKVRVYHLEITSIELPDVTIEISCSKGTYIRSLAVELGKQLGPGAHLKALRRLSSGTFRVEDALDSKYLGSPSSDSFIHDRVIPMREALPEMRETDVDAMMARDIRNGRRPKWGEFVERTDFSGPYEGYLKLVRDGDLVAITIIRQLPGDNNGWLKIMRVFN